MMRVAKCPGPRLRGKILRWALVPTVLAVLLAPGASSAQEGGSARSGTAAAAGPVESPTRWSLGMAVISAPRPYVGSDQEVQVIPLVELSSGPWFVQGIRAGYRFIDSSRLELDARIGFRFSGLEPDSSPFLQGMHKRRETVEGGLGLEWMLFRARNGRLTVGLSALGDLLGRSNGFEGSLGLSWQRVLARGKVVLAPALGIVYQDSNHVAYYYGVSPGESRPGRPPYDGASAVNPRASMFLSWRFHGPWSLLGMASFELLDGPIKNSPTVDQNHELFGLVGVSYSF